ncbi:MAG: response regulator transcription factor [Actinomycetota bacterium]|nr:response regulator transcription factor [Actinomycetota bacterium]
MSRILVVEDEPRIASFLQKGLRAEGHVTTVVDNGDDASALARSQDFDLVLLDVGLPGKDGFAVLADLRGRGERLPVILLTARDAVPDRVNGLDAGADDYVTKPFSFEELRARVRVRLRESSDDYPTTLAAGRVRLDLLSRTATVDGRTVELTAQEFVLAEVLLRHPQQVLSREQLLSQVWGYEYDPGSNIVDVYVGYLRRKLGKAVIETVRGVGYRLHG